MMALLADPKGCRRCLFFPYFLVKNQHLLTGYLFNRLVHNNLFWAISFSTLFLDNFACLAEENDMNNGYCECSGKMQTS